MSKQISLAYADTKPHYELLDGLRGIAALLVVFYHIFEGFSFAAGGTPIVVINHGYLAVDFFFILSGFVIGYAYDDRLGRTMTLGNFFKRRLIRLHPMIVMGAVLGVVFYVLQGCERWDGTHVATSMIILALLCALFFIPAAPGASYDIRGNGEMFPLNGPSWSLFFEYIGNLLYALFIHRLGNKALAVLTALSGIGLAWFILFDAVGYGMIGVGWTLDGMNFFGGLLRMLFPFTLGMLLFPRSCLAGRLRKNHRPPFHTNLQILGRHLIPLVCCTLPRHVPVLLLADREQVLHIPRSLAHGRHGVCKLRTAGLCLPEVVRPTRTTVVDPQIPSSKINPPTFIYLSKPGAQIANRALLC